MHTYIHTHTHTHTYVYAHENTKTQRVEVRAISGRLPWPQAIKAGLLGGLSIIHADRYYLNTGIGPQNRAVRLSKAWCTSVVHEPTAVHVHTQRAR